MHPRTTDAPPHLPLATSLTREHGLEPLQIEGTLPAGLDGVMYRNGPAVFESVEGGRLPHLFDGDGAITMVRFGGGRAHGAVRLVQTPGRIHEHTRGRVRYGGYSTISRRSIRDFFFGGPKNVANTSVMRWRDQVLALWEGGLPTALDPDDLTTIGQIDFDGVVPRAFSAHPHRVPARACTFNFGVRYGLTTRLDIFAMPDEGPIRRLTTVPLAGPTMIHDFIATESHLVFFAPPLRLHLLDLMLGRRGFCHALDWRPDVGTEVIVVPIDTPQAVRRFAVEPFYQWHFANAFDDGDRIVVDLVRYPDFETNGWLQRIYDGQPAGPTTAELGRATIAGERFAYAPLLDRSVEFPVIAPRMMTGCHRYTWMAGHATRETSSRGPHDVLVRFDHETGDEHIWTPGDGHFTSEPLFAPRPGGTAEDAGWLLSLNYAADRGRSYVEVLDAGEPARGSLARVWFDQPIPQTFHGQWYPA